MTLAPEPAVVGAIVTGALAWPDVATLPAAAFTVRWCACVFSLLSAALDARAEGVAVPGPRHGRGLDLAWVLRLCRSAGVATWHRVPGDGPDSMTGLTEADRASHVHVVGWRRRTLADVVRDAPRRPEALRALEAVEMAEEERRVEERARARRRASHEARALRRAYHAWLSGDCAASLQAVVTAERWMVGASPLDAA